ncbi:MAG: hypothetical protein RBU37_24860, partial [Myxococcota bacterium]|nr:hypothetical protein [Myxococcota bacterium]
MSQRVPDPQEERVRGPGRVRGVVFEARREVPVARASITAFGQTQSIVTASNEDGSFEFASFDSFVEVVAEAPGLRNAGADDRGVRLRVDPDSVIDGLRIYLYEPCEVVGSVSGDGRPVEAEVVAHFAQDASGAMDYDAAVTTT